MKTTLNLSDKLIKKAKLYALEHHMNFTQLVESALLLYTGMRGGPAKQFKLKKHPFKNGRGLHKNIEEGNWSQISSIIYEGVGG